MSPDQIKIFMLLAVVVGFFIWGRFRYDLVAFSALLVAVLIGVVPADAAFNGFANSAVITVAAVLIISRGLAVSGAIDRIAHVVVPPVKSLWLQIASMSGFAAILSAFMNNVGALALLMPATVDSAKSAGRSPSLLLMPLSFGSILGGMITLIGTPPNIVIANYRETALGAPYEMFDFAPVGLMVALGGLLYLALVGWRLLPKDRTAKSAPDELFAIDDYVAEVIIPEESKAVGMTIAELDEHIDNCSVRLAGIVQKGRRNLRPGRRTVLEARDILVLEATPKDLDKFTHELSLEVKGDTPKDRAIYSSDNVHLSEVVVSADSRIIGRKAGDLRLRSRYGLNLLGVSRQGKPIRRRLHHVVFRSGDILLVQAEADSFQVSAVSLGLLPLAGRGFQIGHRSQAWIAATLLALAIGLAALGWVKLTISLSAAALGMVLMNIVPLRDVYRSIDWPVIVLVAAMIPVGGALETTGATELVANSILVLAEGWPIALVLGLVFVATMTLSDIMNNVATAVVMAPVAIGIASSLEVNPDTFLMAVAVGASCAFLTPIGHKNNALVMGPGGYKFTDYWRMGLPLEVLITIIAIPALMWIWPLTG